MNQKKPKRQSVDDRQADILEGIEYQSRREISESKLEELREKRERERREREA